jgi:GNAT superfamily N-acetyltransferase
MLRPATREELARLAEIRGSVGENRLRDPGAVTEADYLWFIDRGLLQIWQEPDGTVAGFSAGDPRDGTVWALFVAPGHEGKGIGRALLTAACETLRAAGHRVASLSSDPGTRAERHYRAAGWSVVGHNGKGELVFEKPL